MRTCHEDLSGRMRPPSERLSRAAARLAGGAGGGGRGGGAVGWAGGRRRFPRAGGALGAIAALASCAREVRIPPAAPTTGRRPPPQGRDFEAADLAKSDIDNVAEIHLQESLASARLLMEKLYRRNPRGW